LEGQFILTKHSSVSQGSGSLGTLENDVQEKGGIVETCTTSEWLKCSAG
jgi:hypothetical protein